MSENATTDKKTKPKLKDLGGLHDKPAETTVFDIEKLDEAGLLELRSKIDARLPIKSLDDLDLVQESLRQLQMAKQLQADAAKKDAGVPMNQRAQVQNSISNIITTLAKVQMELHTSERHKRIQSAVVKVVKSLPKEAQDRFFELLEAELMGVEDAAPAEPEAVEGQGEVA
jgi:hypothetical protein